jgi:polar amino acid transport system substrate-binding protein
MTKGSGGNLSLILMFYIIEIPILTDTLMSLFFFRAIFLTSLACLPQAIFAAELRVLVLDGDQMPWMQVDRNKLSAGLYAELGTALAQKMGRTASFTILPRKRLALALEEGSADLICNYIPAWLPGSFDWTAGFIPNVELLISAQSASKPDSLAKFVNVRIGTVLGYAYVELDQALGKGFLRDDAPTMRNNLLKLAAGRIQLLERSHELAQIMGKYR